MNIVVANFLYNCIKLRNDEDNVQLRDAKKTLRYVQYTPSLTSRLKNRLKVDLNCYLYEFWY